MNQANLQDPMPEEAGVVLSAANERRNLDSKIVGHPGALNALSEVSMFDFGKISTEVQGLVNSICPIGSIGIQSELNEPYLVSDSNLGNTKLLNVSTIPLHNLSNSGEDTQTTTAIDGVVNHEKFLPSQSETTFMSQLLLKATTVNMSILPSNQINEGYSPMGPPVIKPVPVYPGYRPPGRNELEEERVQPGTPQQTIPFPCVTQTELSDICINNNSAELAPIFSISQQSLPQPNYDLHISFPYTPLCQNPMEVLETEGLVSPFRVDNAQESGSTTVSCLEEDPLMDTDTIETESLKDQFSKYIPPNDMEEWALLGDPEVMIQKVSCNNVNLSQTLDLINGIQETGIDPSEVTASQVEGNYDASSSFNTNMCNVETKNGSWNLNNINSSNSMIKDSPIPSAQKIRNRRSFLLSDFIEAQNEGVCENELISPSGSNGFSCRYNENLNALGHESFDSSVNFNVAHMNLNSVPGEPNNSSTPILVTQNGPFDTSINNSGKLEIDILNSDLKLLCKRFERVINNRAEMRLTRNNNKILKTIFEDVSVALMPMLEHNVVVPIGDSNWVPMLGRIADIAQGEILNFVNKNLLTLHSAMDQLLLRMSKLSGGDTKEINRRAQIIKSSKKAINELKDNAFKITKKMENEIVRFDEDVRMTRNSNLVNDNQHSLTTNRFISRSKFNLNSVKDVDANSNRDKESNKVILNIPLATVLTASKMGQIINTPNGLPVARASRRLRKRSLHAALGSPISVNWSDNTAAKQNEITSMGKWSPSKTSDDFNCQEIMDVSPTTDHEVGQSGSEPTEIMNRIGNYFQTSKATPTNITVHDNLEDEGNKVFWPFPNKKRKINKSAVKKDKAAKIKNTLVDQSKLATPRIISVKSSNLISKAVRIRRPTGFVNDDISISESPSYAGIDKPESIDEGNKRRALILEESEIRKQRALNLEEVLRKEEQAKILEAKEKRRRRRKELENVRKGEAQRILDEAQKIISNQRIVDEAQRIIDNQKKWETDQMRPEIQEPQQWGLDSVLPLQGNQLDTQRSTQNNDFGINPYKPNNEVITNHHGIRQPNLLGKEIGGHVFRDWDQGFQQHNFMYGELGFINPTTPTYPIMRGEGFPNMVMGNRQEHFCELRGMRSGESVALTQDPPIDQQEKAMEASYSALVTQGISRRIRNRRSHDSSHNEDLF